MNVFNPYLLLGIAYPYLPFNSIVLKIYFKFQFVTILEICIDHVIVVNKLKKLIKIIISILVKSKFVIKCVLGYERVRYKAHSTKTVMEQWLYSGGVQLPLEPRPTTTTTPSATPSQLTLPLPPVNSTCARFTASIRITLSLPLPILSLRYICSTC